MHDQNVFSSKYGWKLGRQLRPKSIFAKRYHFQHKYSWNHVMCVSSTRQPGPCRTAINSCLKNTAHTNPVFTTRDQFMGLFRMIPVWKKYLACIIAEKFNKKTRKHAKAAHHHSKSTCEQPNLRESNQVVPASYSGASNTISTFVDCDSQGQILSAEQVILWDLSNTTSKACMSAAVAQKTSKNAWKKKCFKPYFWSGSRTWENMDDGSNHCVSYGVASMATMNMPGEEHDEMESTMFAVWSMVELLWQGI